MYHLEPHPKHGLDRRKSVVRVWQRFDVIGYSLIIVGRIMKIVNQSFSVHTLETGAKQKPSQTLRIGREEMSRQGRREAGDLWRINPQGMLFSVLQFLAFLVGPLHTLGDPEGANGGHLQAAYLS